MVRFTGLWIFEWLWCLCDLLLKPRKLSYQKGYQKEADCGKLDTKAYESWTKRRFTLPSDFGYRISCELIEPKGEEEGDSADTIEPKWEEEDNPAGATEPKGREKLEDNSKKIAILCHGLGCAKYHSIKYVELFLKLGFTVLIYDHRNHGRSGRALTSMGFYEKFDLRSVLDWCCDHYGDQCRFVTHGESMGAATVLLHLGIDHRVSCAIADCSYADLKQLLKHQLKEFYHLPSFLIPVESLLTYLRAGFWYREVSPISVVAMTDTPILFIHGKIDIMVPASMSKKMYAVKRQDKALYLVAGAKHAQSYCKNKEGYQSTIRKFLSRYGLA